MRWLQDTDEIVLLNDGTKTRFNRANSTETAIDLSFASASLASRLLWRVTRDSLSDHYVLHVGSTGRYHQAPPPLRPRWIYGTANWHAFRAALLPTQDNGVDSPESITATIRSAADVSIQKRSTSAQPPNCTTPIWWSSACKAAVRHARAATRRARRSGRLSDWIVANRLDAISRRTVRSARTTSWRSYCDSLSSSTPLTEVWRKVRWFRGTSPPATIALSTTGPLVTDPSIVANTLADHFATAFTPPTNYSPPAPSPIQHTADLSGCNAPFTMGELQRAVARLRNTSPGADGVSNLMLRNLPPEFLSRVLQVYNTCWEARLFPSEWKKAILLPVPKPNKDQSLPASYRPIALLPVIGKLYERLILVRLSWILETSAGLTPFQSGFRPGRRATDHSLRLTLDAHTAIAEKGFCQVAFLDLAGAFDHVVASAVLVRLRDFKISGHLLAALSGFMTDRSFQVLVDNRLSVTHHVQCGVPQGALISPLLFSLILDRLPLSLPTEVSCGLHADDIAIWATNKDFTSAAKNLQRALDNTSSYLRAWGQVLAPLKCHTLCITQKRIRPPLSLQIEGVALEEVTSAKYLGVIFDRGLTWRPHISSLATSCVKVLNILRSVTGSFWGMDRSTLRTLYISLIRSRLSYSCLLYESAARGLLTRLDRIQHAALRVTLGVPRTTAIAGLCAETGVLPLDLHRDLHHIDFLGVCRASPRGQFYHTEFLNRVPALSRLEGRWGRRGPPAIIRALSLESHHGIEGILSSVAATHQAALFPPWFDPNLTITHDWLHLQRSTVPPETLRTAFAEAFLALPSSDLILFTDGSATPDSAVAAGAFVTSPPAYVEVFTVSREHPIAYVELFAIFRAISYATGLGVKSVTICSDSKTALQMIAARNQVNPVVDAIHSLLAGSHLSVRLIWVPSHTGIKGNELADSSARLALAERPEPLTDIVPLRFKSIRAITKRSINAAWRLQWDSGVTGRLLYLVKPDPATITLRGVSLSRPVERILALIRANRLPVGNVLHRFGLRLTPLCYRCGGEDNYLHFFFRCARFTHLRHPLFRAIEDAGLLLKVRSILQAPAITTQKGQELCLAIAAYVRNTGVLGRQ